MSYLLYMCWSRQYGFNVEMRSHRNQKRRDSNPGPPGKKPPLGHLSHHISLCLKTIKIYFRLFFTDIARHRCSATQGCGRQCKINMQLWDGGWHPLLGEVVQRWPGVLPVRSKWQTKITSLPTKRNPCWRKLTYLDYIVLCFILYMLTLQSLNLCHVLSVYRRWVSDT